MTSRLGRGATPGIDSTTPEDQAAAACDRACRRAGRQGLLELARSYVESLDPAIEVQAAVVVGSVARGDFHDTSDVDVLVVARHLPDDPADRWRLVAPRHGVVQPIAWTVAEWHNERRRRNPLAVDAITHGVWLVGAPGSRDNVL